MRISTVMMHKLLKGLIVIVVLLIQCGDLFAQQNALFSQYMFNTLAFNPAYAGSRNVATATALYRNQWVGIEGAPNTGTFTMDAPFANERLGLGIQLISDKVGITKTTGIAVSSAFRIPINDGSLSFGLQGSMNNYHAAYSRVNLDPSVPDRAFTSDANKTLYNFGSGIYYRNSRLYAGFSVQDFVRNRLNNDTIDVGDVTARQSAHAYLATGYVFPLGLDFNLKTSMLLKGVKGAPLQASLNTTLWIKELIAIGVEYRTSADISAMMEVKVSPRVSIGYAYDKSMTSLRTLNSGSHEFMLKYEFSFDRDRILSPRYF